MNKCKDCIHYDNEDTYQGSGYCHLNDMYIKDNDNCEDYEEEEDEN